MMSQKIFLKISVTENNRLRVPEKSRCYQDNHHFFSVQNGDKIADHHELRDTQAGSYQEKENRFSEDVVTVHRFSLAGMLHEGL